MKYLFWRGASAVALLASLLALTGCASISEEQCLLSNPSAWERRGRSDAQGGKSTTRLSQYQQDCAKVGVLPDDKAYLRGWSQGVLEYCTPHSAYEVGRRGYAGNAQICPGDSGRLFQANWTIGNNIYQVSERVSNLQSDIRSLEWQLSKSESDPRAQSALQRRLQGKQIELIVTDLHLTTLRAVPMVLR